MHRLPMVLAPDALAFHSLTISEAPRVPEIAHYFFRSGPDTANQLLASISLKRSEQENLAVHDPHAATAISFDGLIDNL